jgi:hypothetical protein
LCIINNKYKTVMADKIKKNLLGRTVTVKREAMSDGALAKTRTVKSKSGGTISSKTSYKDAGSVAGKMRANKMTKLAQPRLKSSDKKEGMADAVRGGRRNAIKLNEARTELKRNPAIYDAAVVKKALDTGRGGKVKRVMKREMMKGRPF